MKRLEDGGAVGSFARWTGLKNPKVNRGTELTAFSMNGHEGQFVVCVPKLDLIVVRLGYVPLLFMFSSVANGYLYRKTPSGPKSVAVLQHIARVIDSFADTEEAVAREQGWDTIAAKI
jgi:CubicO group peptidase (beta-lactamase class C family)